MKVIQLFIHFLRLSPYILLLPIVITNVLFPDLRAVDFSYIPIDYSEDIIEGGSVSTSNFSYID